MEQNKRVIELGIIPEDEISGCSAIALVEEPAIELDFRYFNKEKFVTPSAGESEDEFISRCIPVVIGEGKDQDQAAAICYSYWDEKMSTEKFESYNDYPESAKNAAKRALEIRNKNPDLDCGTAVGWVRANQLAKGENISEDTIARMASFARHKQNSEGNPNEDCGALMWLCWGGTAGIEWASNKLKEIRGEDFQIINPDKEMIDGVIDLLNDVEDLDNRLSMAREIVDQFIEEGVQFDIVDFMNRIGFHNFEIDTTGLTSYVDPGIKKKRIEEVYSAEVLDTIIAMAAEMGYSEDEVEIVTPKEKFANPKDADYTPARTITQADGVEKLYRYESSRVADNSRSFCRRMMGLKRFYSREEIDALDTFNEEFGPGTGGGQYSIFLYLGGTNCQHYWQPYEAQRIGRKLQLTPIAPESREEMRANTAPRTTQGRGYVKRPQRSLPPLAGHSAFSKMLFADDEKKIVVGACMIPNIEIYRRDEDGDPYYVKFSEETIKEIAMKYMKQARTNDINQDHIEDKDAGTYIFESWIVEDPETDKAKTIYGYDVPKGTWMCAMKVEDPAVWKRIKDGELKGFSVEGSFADMEDLQARKNYEKIKSILKG